VLRAWPGGLTTARAIGFCGAGDLVSPIPHASTLSLPPGGGDVVLASDGVWSVLPTSHVAAITRAASLANSACAMIVHSAVARRHDLYNDDPSAATLTECDTTCIVIRIRPPGPSRGMSYREARTANRVKHHYPCHGIGSGGGNSWHPESKAGGHAAARAALSTEDERASATTASHSLGSGGSGGGSGGSTPTVSSAQHASSGCSRTLSPNSPLATLEALRLACGSPASPCSSVIGSPASSLAASARLPIARPRPFDD